MAYGRGDLNVENLTRVSVRRFSFLMKCIAENNMWDEVELYLEELGCTDVIVSVEPIGAVQELFKRKIAAGEQLSPRTKVVIECGCGVSHPGPPGGPPKSPGGGGGDGGPPPPPTGGGGPPPPLPPLRNSDSRDRRWRPSKARH